MDEDSNPLRQRAECEKFEAWINIEGTPPEYTEKLPNGWYVLSHINNAWLGWIARASDEAQRRLLDLVGAAPDAASGLCVHVGHRTTLERPGVCLDCGAVVTNDPL